MNFGHVRSAYEAFERDAEQIEGLQLNIGELRREGLDGFFVAEQRVPFGEAEEAQYLLGGRSLAEALFGVDR